MPFYWNYKYVAGCMGVGDFWGDQERRTREIKLRGNISLRKESYESLSP